MSSSGKATASGNCGLTCAEGRPDDDLLLPENPMPFTVRPFSTVISEIPLSSAGWALTFGLGLAGAALALLAYRERRATRKALQGGQDSLRKYVDFVNGRVEHLHFEFGKMSCLPLNHPRRQALVDEVVTQLLPIRSRLDKVLFPGHEPLGDLDWMRKLPNRKFPYSLTDEEGLVLYDLVTRLGLRNGYEIATAFGYSSFYLGLAFKKNGGRLVSMDAYVEEARQDFVYDEALAKRHAEEWGAGAKTDLPEGLRFALAGAEELGLGEIVRYEVGFSPLDVPSVLRDERLDFAFIDGSHFGEAPCADVDAVMPYMNRERCLLVFHDTHCEAVAKAVFHAAEKLGGDVISLNTRNRLVVVSRNVNLQAVLNCRDILARQYR